MGYNKGERTEYWKDIKNKLTNINKNDCILWCTDNNGQIMIIMKMLKTLLENGAMEIKRKKKGMEGKLKKNIINFNLTAANTMYNPNNNGKENLVTWYSNTNNIKKQLDYILISNKHKLGTKLKNQRN